MMFKNRKDFLFILLLVLFMPWGMALAQKPADLVNVFLGTSGDHGQLSPAASYPFSMLSIGPQTYPATHPGYDYYAKEFRGFTHNRMEGVGCQGDGGNLLVKPFSGDWKTSELIKKSQEASPGFYSVKFKNGIAAEFTVNKRQGIHHYTFKSNNNGLYVDLSYAFVGRFKSEEHKINGREISGFIESGTTCSRGSYKIYYYLKLSEPVKLEQVGEHQFVFRFPENIKEVELKIAFSSVDVAHAKKNLTTASFSELKKETIAEWNKKLMQIQVSGNQSRNKLFYSLLYRSLQSPYTISEEDNSYRANNGRIYNSKNTFYNGWAIWDNYKTQLPLLSFAFPQEYQNMIWSIAQMYQYGKKDFSTENEPSQTVRTEHAVVVLLDAYRKGYKVPFDEIIDSLIIENKRLDFSTPDKALESCYDTWALAEIFKETNKTAEAQEYLQKASTYKKYWKKDFADLSKSDVDQMSARRMYQGTIWQYRWLVPYDVKGLKELAGGKDSFLAELDQFFDRNYYNHANETDVQVPWMFQATEQPWKSQALIHEIALDTVIQFYFNGNTRGIDPYIGRIYKNEPKAFLRTMDDDAGAMSSWFVLAGVGITPACVGWPKYFIHVPLFKSVIINEASKHPFKIDVQNYGDENKYIQELVLNGKVIHRNWITQQEIEKGGALSITASATPVKDEITELWQSLLN